MSSTETGAALQQDPAKCVGVLRTVLPDKEEMAWIVRNVIRKTFSSSRFGPWLDIGEPTAYEVASAIVRAAEERLAQRAEPLPAGTDEPEEVWPEGVQFVRRAAKRLTPDMRRRVLGAMEQFLEG